MRRRDFIAGFGGAATLPLVARAQQRQRSVRIGILFGGTRDPPIAARVSAFQQTLARRGWVEGRNVRFDDRFAGGDRDLLRKFAGELVDLRPEIVLAGASASLAALKQASRTVPIVFVEVTDPVGAGLVESLPRPGGNATGFLSEEYGFAAKWLELLKQIAPRVTRAAVLRDPVQFAGVAHFAAIQAVAPSLRVEAIPIDVRDADTMKRSVAEFARGTNGGLIVLPSFATQILRQAIVALAAELRLPAVYFERDFIDAGGLISYGPDIIEEYRLAADYADRVLMGAKPADLPVQAPTKYLTVLNTATAKALGIDVPPSILVRADAVIE